MPRDRGRIIQIGSALAYRGIPLQSAYCGTKHAIQGFTESVRAELLHDHSHVKISMVQLPAVNTPQFRWVKSRLPHQPQPVPPIYEPEVIADAVVYLADHYRRQLFVGASTVIVIQANKLVPGFGDRYLARTGYQSQQTGKPASPHRPNNLGSRSMAVAGIMGHAVISAPERKSGAGNCGPIRTGACSPSWAPVRSV